MSAPGKGSPFRADGRYEHAVSVPPPAEARPAIARLQRSGLSMAAYIRILGAGVVAYGAASLLSDQGPAVPVLSALVGGLLLWLGGRVASQMRESAAAMDSTLGSDRHPCQLERTGFRLERPELSARWSFESVRRLAVVDRFVVVEVGQGEALVLEPQGDPEELAAWIREHAPSLRRLASWHWLAILAAIYGAICAAFIAALFVA